MKDFLKYTLATIVGVLLSGVVGFFLLASIVTAILSFSDQPTIVEENSMLVLTLDNEIVERAEDNPFSGIDFMGVMTLGQTGLDDILESIEKAKDDENILGIYLNPSSISAGIATVEEIRDALIDFKESGKFIYAYSENISQLTYYLVSVADKIMLNPVGTVDFKGLSAQVMFYKDILDKVGVEVQIIRHGKFKSAVEPYMLNEMSDASRLQTEAYANSIWDQIVADISVSRGISVEKLNELADGTTTFMTAQDVLANGMVDALMYKDEVLAELKEKTSTEEKDDLHTVGISEYKNVPEKTDGKGLARDKIAVIYASGGIDTQVNNALINSEDLSRTIREARRDSSIKAIVLRINSPGGSAYGSDVIWREVQLAAETKPLIASMGDYAASGGYYIAAAADTIMADRTTITGSIGVYGTIPNAGELLNDKLGINVDVVNTNDYSDILNYTRPMSAYEEALIQDYVEKIYDDFITHVSDGRSMDKADVDEIGQGRVWDSVNAQNIGLVDLFGGVNDAIDLAAELANVERYRVVKLPEMQDPLIKLLGGLSTSIQTKFLKNKLGDQYLIYQQIEEVVNARGIYARIPYAISFE